MSSAVLDQPAQTEPLEMAHASARFVRQEDFVPSGSLEGRTILVIGCGAIGRQVALQLAAIGVRKLILCDFDAVILTNLTTQGYLAADMNDEKVHALEKAVKAIDPEIEVELIVDRFRPQYVREEMEIVFLCVDTINAREAIWNMFKDKDGLILVDGRMLGEVMRIIAVNDHDTKKHYPTTLFPPSETAQGRCTGQGTIYTANIAAGLMLHQFTRCLRSAPIDPDMTFCLLDGDYFSSMN